MAKEAQDDLVEVRKKLEQTNIKYKAVADKHQCSKVFEDGGSVMVFICNERFSVETCSKLKQRKYGLYKIQQKINNNAYVIDLPNSIKKSKTFNVADSYKFLEVAPLF